MPPLNAIRAFEAAARRSSFKDAAAELGVTHGAVSRQIRLLEEWLGPPALFRRLSHGVALTAEGQALFAEIHPALERIAGAAALHGRKASGTVVLRVNALATFSLRWLVPKLGLLREAHPDIEIELTTGNEPVDGLADDYDLIIRGGPDAFHGFEARLLLPERRLPACSPTLLRRQPLDEVGDLARHTLLHVASMPRLWRDWLAQAGHGSLEPAATLTLDHFYLSIQAAVDGLGVAMAPSTLIEDDLRAGRLMTPFPHISLPSRSYFAYTPLGSPLRAESERVCAWIEAFDITPPTQIGEQQ
ncbi:MAG: LysR substrate-binding domain-containing protein [Ferrovibrio sp.]|uniref:LysR substrate-binding domain-containing protein n=1 Tax=Ferrovibrio sp. TaxID=1917215 RepID=UPI00260F03EE|nr:LysR substrate-binding domain-containing protein [Ferrovibrio sp.]MCW0232115.1 LysR substrate-binding domain-containing protein [Ferrovibrio sp.]